jgi:hypothetical protein
MIMMRKVALWIGVAVAIGWSSGASALPVNNPITAGLVAAYGFSGNADDVSGNGNNGVVNGATLTTDRFGNLDSAYSFDGVDDYIVSSTTFSPQASGTISVWFSPFGTTLDNRDVVSSRSDNGYLAGDFMLGTHFVNNAPSVCYWGSSGNWHCAEETVTAPFTTDWISAVWTWDMQDESKFYVDGELIAAAPITLSIFGDLQLDIGRMSLVHSPTCCSSFFGGSIDDLYIYDRALSPSEIQTIYSAVPEPSTALLLGIGLSALAATRRKRSRSVDTDLSFSHEKETPGAPQPLPASCSPF